MTTQVDFYILENETAATYLKFACRIIEKAYQEKHSVWVICQDQNQQNTLNDLLWTFKDISFIPHQIRAEAALDTPIVLTYLNDSAQRTFTIKDICLNLSLEAIETFQSYTRLIEIVPNDEKLKHLGRTRFAYYRDQGALMKTHKIE